MTPEQIDKLEAGRELDALVGEKVFNYDGICQVAGCSERHDPHYSTDIAAAWLVVEKLRQMQRTITLGSLGVLPEPLSWGCNVFRGVRQLETVTQAVGDTAPLAICRAALKANECSPVN